MKTTALLLGLACVMPFNAGFASGNSEDTSMQSTCRQDSDCKLIYSSCTCMVVGIADPRESLENEHGMACHHNACLSEHARAVCDAGICSARLPAGSTLKLPCVADNCTDSSR